MLITAGLTERIQKISFISNTQTDEYEVQNTSYRFYARFKCFKHKVIMLQHKIATRRMKWKSLVKCDTRATKHTHTPSPSSSSSLSLLLFFLE